MNDKHLFDRRKYPTHVDRTHSLTINSSLQIRVKGKMINAKSTTCTTDNRFVNATANGKKYFCEFDGGIWKVVGKA